MTKKSKTENRNSSGKRSFRRWVKQVLASVVKCHNRETEEILERLQDIQDSIEIIAREMARWGRQVK